jgi:hypothetical protein
MTACLLLKGPQLTCQTLAVLASLRRQCLISLTGAGSGALQLCVTRLQSPQLLLQPASWTGACYSSSVDECRVAYVPVCHSRTVLKSCVSCKHVAEDHVMCTAGGNALSNDAIGTRVSLLLRLSTGAARARCWLREQG